MMLDINNIGFNSCKFKKRWADKKLNDLEPDANLEPDDLESHDLELALDLNRFTLAVRKLKDLSVKELHEIINNLKNKRNK